ncbi:MAG: hypothetical protein LBE56_14390 [Tannerella sp.]|jgi:hypothetical protein|nr:hypothetical protein [Tannerella sp.]
MLSNNYLRSFLLLCIFFICQACQDDENISIGDEYRQYMEKEPDMIIENATGTLAYIESMDMWYIYQYIEGTIDAYNDYLIVEIPDLDFSFKDQKEVTVSGLCYSMPTQIRTDLAINKGWSVLGGSTFYFIKITDLKYK